MPAWHRRPAKCPRSPWHPETHILHRLVSAHLPDGPLGLVIKTFDVARHNRCLQPPGNPRAVATLGDLWKQLSGDKRQQAPACSSTCWARAVGLFGGLILGYAAEDEPTRGCRLWPWWSSAWWLGVGAAHFIRGNMGWNYCMMRLIISERRSPVRKAMVTDQAELWVPKALMLHRQKEWKNDRNGRHLHAAAPRVPGSGSPQPFATSSIAWICLRTCT